MTQLGYEGNPLGIVQEIEIWPYEQIVFEQNNISPGKWDTETHLGFWHPNGSLKLARQQDLIIIKKKKKRTRKIVNFAVPADLRVKLKEN